MIKLAYIIIVSFCISSYGHADSVPPAKIESTGSFSGTPSSVWLLGVQPKPATRCRRGHFAVAIPIDMQWQDADRHTRSSTTYVCPLCLFDALQKLATDPTTTTNSVRE